MVDTLEAALERIARDNDYTSVTVGRMPVGERIVFTADVHWDGYSARNICCQSGHSEKSIHDALINAINAAVVDRSPAGYLPPELPAMQEAA